MLDSLVLNIPFNKKHIQYRQNRTVEDMGFVDAKDLKGVGLQAKHVEVRDDDVVLVSGLSTKFESLPSSMSGMAMKIYNENHLCHPFVSIKCSPCKLLQGHNLYGFDNLRVAAENMIFLVMDQFPDLYGMLDPERIQVSSLDITYSTFVKCPSEKNLFMDHLRNVSKGQTRNRGDNYATSVYFGSKRSRLKKLKAYIKDLEMKEDATKQLRKGFLKSSEIIKDLISSDFAKQAVRFEATIMSRFLERRGIPSDLKGLLSYVDSNPDFYKDLFLLSWKDVFESFKGQNIMKLDDASVYESIYETHHKITKLGNISTSKVQRLYDFYQTLKVSGYYFLKERASSFGNSSSQRRTFDNNVSALIEAGFSRSYLQNLNSGTGAQVIPLARFLDIDFSVQVPDGYRLPRNLWEEAS